MPSKKEEKDIRQDTGGRKADERRSRPDACAARITALKTRVAKLFQKLNAVEMADTQVESEGVF